MRSSSTARGLAPDSIVMCAVVGAVVLLALPGCAPDPTPTPPRPPKRATSVVSTTLRREQLLIQGAQFSVSADGRGIVNAVFGPRQVSKLVTEEEPAASFSASEFPEGRGTMFFSIQGGREQAFRVEKVGIDRTQPELVRIGGTRLRPGVPLRLYLYDAFMLGSLKLSIGDVKIEQELPRESATTALVPVEIDSMKLPEGKWDVDVWVRDAAGNVLETKIAGVRVDRTKPRARFQEPAEGAKISGLVTLTAYVSDNLDVASVEFRAAGSGLGEALGPRASLTVDTGTFPKGPITFEAIPQDATGNIGEPVVVNAVVE